MKKCSHKTYLIDLDETLCRGTSWTASDCLKAKPVEKMVSKVNELYRTHYIIIYTARQDDLIPATLEWLRRNNVRYHAISNLKVPGFYVDDRAISFEDFLNL